MSIEVEHRTVRANGLDLHVALAGPPDAPPVVLLHGWPQTWRCWSRVAERLPGFRLVLPDLRGLGDSDGPEPGPEGAGYAKREMAADVVALVGELELGRVVVAGHDWGGVVAVHAASLLGSAARSGAEPPRRRPDTARARGLVVVDVTVPNDLGAGVDIAQGGGRWHHAFHRTSLPETLIAGREDAYYSWFHATFAATPDAVDPTWYVDAYRDPARTRAGLALYRATGRDVDDARAIGHHGLAMPVLAVGGGTSWGRGDEPRACLEYFAADVTGGVVEGAGHFVPEEAPEELADRMRAFLDGLPA